jgi:hypothetical protein
VGGIGQRPQAIVKGGRGFDAAVFSGEPLDEVLAGFPNNPIGRRSYNGVTTPADGQLAISSAAATTFNNARQPRNYC